MLPCSLERGEVFAILLAMLSGVRLKACQSAIGGGAAFDFGAFHTLCPFR